MPPKRTRRHRLAGRVFRAGTGAALHRPCGALPCAAAGGQLLVRTHMRARLGRLRAALRQGPRATAGG